MMTVSRGAHDGTTPLDPDDTRRCPTGDACDTCGAVDDLAVGTGETPLGICCLTLCGSCAEAGDTPSWTLAQAMAHVIEHAEHLGTTLDALAAADRRRRETEPRATCTGASELCGSEPGQTCDRDCPALAPDVPRAVAPRPVDVSHVPALANLARILSPGV